MGIRATSTTMPMPRGGGPELNEYAQEVKVILENAFAELGGAATPLTASTGLVAANNLSDVVSAATSRTNLGLAIGTNVEAWDADLDALAALSSASANAGQVPMVANAGGWSLGTALMDDRIINGAMRIDQRRVGAIVTPAASVYTLDRWQNQQSTGSKLSIQQAFSITPAFTHSLKVTVAASFSPGAGDVYTVRQAIEGNNIADLAWGTASAKPVIVSFWVQSSITGVYNVALKNSASARAYGATFTIAVANTPQYVTLAIPGDTSGTWATDTSAGIWLQFDLGSGSNFTFAAGSWTASNLYSATGATKFVSQVNGSTFYVTGVRLQPGSIATPLVLRPHGLELMLSQRYFQKSYAQSAAIGSATGSVTGCILGFANSSNNYYVGQSLPVTMRASPAATAYSYVTGASGVVRNDSTIADVAIAGIFPAETSVYILAAFGGVGQQGQAHYALESEL